MLPLETFKTIVSSTPLVSVDLIIKKNNKILLGKRKNKPAQEYYFTIGGRVFKNEKLKDAIGRIAREELNLNIEKEPRFIGVFEHFYEESIFTDISTHYINLGFELEITQLAKLPKEQHSEYKWFTINKLLENKNVHKYVKEYFIGTEFAIRPNN